MTEHDEGSASTGSPPAAEHTPATEELDKLWSDPPGLWGQLRAVQNSAIGTRLLLTGFFFLLLGGSFDSFVMRAQLARPESTLVSAELYNQLFTNHGSVTMFLVILPIFEGFAILMLPLLLGSREMPFPRLGAFAYWTFLLGGLLYYSSTLFELVPDAGWFAYTPLSGPQFSPDLKLDFWVLGLGVAEVGAIAAAIEIIIGILKMRAPGMTLTRLPLFAWAMLVTAFMILFAFTTLIVGSLLLELDRGFGTRFFDPDAGGSSLLWQHLFWIFGHPEVYIQFLPAAGIVSMIVPVFARRRTIGYSWIVASMVAIGFLAFSLWAHHMFTTGLPPIVLGFFAAASMAISIPAGVQIFAWVATIAAGKPRFPTPMLFVVGFLVTFVIGGITGVMVAAVPFDLLAHDSYFVVAHLHYVLIGGVAFPIFAGVYYWFPKNTGKMLNERLGKWNFWLLFVGVNVTFFPMHIVGLMGMPRRVYTYEAGLGWDVYNLISSIGVLIILPGLAVFVLNVVWTWFKGEPAGRDPWGADSLEWALGSPPKQHAWSVHPIVHSRHPLWDQDDLHTGDPKIERMLQALGRWPVRWRAALVTGTADGRPEEVFRVSGPGISPLFAAIGVVIIFAAELLKLRWGAVGGLALVIVSVIAWNRPQPAPMSEAEEEAFEREHGVPVRAGGSAVIARWGVGLGMLVVLISFGAFLLSYFYLRLENPMWPPPGISTPGLQTPIATSALVASGAAATFVALRRIRRGEARATLASLAAALALGGAGIGLQFRSIAGFAFDSKTHAFGSIFHALGGFAIGVAAAAWIFSAFALYWASKGSFTARRHVPILNAARVSALGAVVWLGGFGTLYLGPRLT